MKGQATLLFGPRTRQATRLIQVVVEHQDLQVEPIRIYLLGGAAFEFTIEGMEMAKQALWFDPRDFSLFGDLTFITETSLGAFEEQAAFV